MAEDRDFQITFFEAVLKREPAYVDVIEVLGGLYTRVGRLDEGLRMDRRLVRLQPDNATAHYNLGCSLALKRRKADALRALRKAVSCGYRDVQWMREDPDLDCLRAHSGFQALLHELNGLAGQGSPVSL